MACLEAVLPCVYGLPRSSVFENINRVFSNVEDSLVSFPHSLVLVHSHTRTHTQTTGTYKLKKPYRYAPIKATYRVNFTKDRVANVLLQFKFLSGKFEKESCVFEHCEIRVPFFRTVKTMSLKASIGSISLNQHRNAVIWIPGTKISKDEGVLSGT